MSHDTDEIIDGMLNRRGDLTLPVKYIRNVYWLTLWTHAEIFALEEYEYITFRGIGIVDDCKNQYSRRFYKQHMLSTTISLTRFLFLFLRSLCLVLRYNVNKQVIKCTRIKSRVSALRSHLISGKSNT